MYLRASYEMYRNELGHVSTSKIIRTASYVHTFYLLLIGMLIVLYSHLGYSYGALVVTFVACFVSWSGLVNIGMVDYGELCDIAKEISRPVVYQQQQQQQQ